MSKAFITLLWIASALLTYWLGLEQGSENSYSELEDKQVNFTPPAVSQKKKIEQQVRSDSSSATLSSEPSSRDVLQSDTVRDEEIIVETQSTDLQERVKSSNPIVRLRAFTELLEDGSSQSIEQAKEIYEKLPEGPQRFSELRMLAYSWGQSDPQAALEWSKKLGGFDQRIGTGSVLDSWSRYDSAGAIAWAKENFEGEDNPYYIGIISGMSENDLIGASELMATLPYGRTRGRAASILVEKTWQMGEEAAINFADNLPEGSIQNYAYGEVAKKIAKDDLGRAVQWVEKMDESEVKVRVSEDVAERWARESPAEAAEWVSRMPEGEARSESMEEVVTQWARKDPTATAEWLNQFPSGELMDEPIQRFVREVARKDPDTALTWAQSITDEERRKKVEADVLNIKVMQAQREQAEASGTPDPQGDRRPRRGPPNFP
ncbi:MAG: hypothetical protein VXZ32_02475 [Verrucomicrobiota bacterium]|nr:hypothetical protein [Verrucomicrobiota bacterium]